MKRRIIALFFLPLLITLLCTGTRGAEVYEFDLSLSNEDDASEKTKQIIDSLPEDIKESLPDKGAEDYSEYDTEYFFSLLKEGIKKALAPAFRTGAFLLGSVIIASLFHIFSDSICKSEIKGAFSFCSSLCIALCIFSAMEGIFSVSEVLLSVLSKTMLAVIPAMEAVYISGGNLTAATVSQTGVNLMIGFVETLFSNVLRPMVYSVFILGVCAGVSGNKTVSFMSRSLKGLITGGVIIVMTVMTFVLALQNSSAAAADSLATKTLKFAIGNYIPIVGGSVADSFSLLSGSMGVIKQACGTVGIVVLLIALIPPLFVMLLNRLSLSLCSSCATVLGCEREGELLSECKSIATLLISICTGAAVMYIIAIGIFCKTPIAVGG